MKLDPKTQQKSSSELEDLRRQLLDAHETLEAIREGEIDALVVSGKSGEKIYTLVNADQPYRLLLEGMSEGALTISLDGVILFCNQRFAEMVQSPLNKVVGSDLLNWISSQQQHVLTDFLKMETSNKRRIELSLIVSDGTLVPIYLSVSKLLVGGEANIYCLVATDLTEEKRWKKSSQLKRWR